VSPDVSIGQVATVAVSVTTVWTGPGASRSCDAAAVAAMPDIPRWVAKMTTGDRLGLHGRTLTQLLLGDRVLIEDVVDDWAKIIAPSQGCPNLDPRGYAGWLPTAHLTPTGADRSDGDLYIVDAITTQLFEAPAGKPADMEVVLGTNLTADGPVRAGHLPVIIPGRSEPLWVKPADLAAAPTQPPTGRQVLEVAERLVDVPYVWGGVSPYGIDCSGLVYLAHHRLGVVVPRDAADQADASRCLSAAEARPGDLFFFGRPGCPVHHVGFVTEELKIFHASGTGGRVQHDTVAGELADTLLGVHRTVA